MRRHAVACVALVAMGTPYLYAENLPAGGSGVPDRPAAELNAMAYRLPVASLREVLSGDEATRAEKLSGALKELLAASRLDPDGFRSADYMLGMQSPYSSAFLTDRAGNPVVDITVKGDAKKVAEALKAMPGVDVLGVADAAGYSMVSAAMPPEKFLAAVGIDGVATMHGSAAQTGALPKGDHPSYPGPPVAQARAGAVDTQAVAALDVDDFRRVFPGIDGTGIWIGTLSDSANQLNTVPNDGGLFGIDESQASGDLPGDSRVFILEDWSGTNETDEGRAMMEHVYDIAPGASRLAFATAFTGEAGFAANITDLQNGLYDIINDDVVYWDEPMYQDGPVAQAAIAACSNRSYFALNHNYGNESYEALFTDADADGFHDFSGSAREIQSITIPPNSQLVMRMQWGEFWGSATRDLQLRLYDAGVTTLLASSAEANATTLTPNDALIYNNTSASPLNANLAVARLSGTATGMRFKYVVFRGGNLTEYDNNRAGTLTPHAGTGTPIAIGAANYWTRGTPTGYSGRGPHRRLFTTGGAAVNTLFTKPDFLSIDGCDTTFFGSDADGNGRPNFFGTSAATPHAAAVAALLQDLKGGAGSLTHAEIREIFRATAVDTGTAGHDVEGGYGRINALGAGIYVNGMPAHTDFFAPNQFGQESRSITFANSAQMRTISYAYPPGCSPTFTASSTAFDPLIVSWILGGNWDGIVYNNSVSTTAASISPTPASFSRRGEVTVVSESDFAGSALATVQMSCGAFDSQSVPLDTYGDGLISDTLTLAEPIKFVKATAPPELIGGLIVELNCGPALDGVITVFNSAGTRIGYADSGFAGDGEQLFVDGIAAGQEYYVGVMSYFHDTRDNFQVFMNFETAPGQPATCSELYSNRLWPNPVTGIAQETLPFTTAVGSYFQYGFTPIQQDLSIQTGGDGSELCTLGIYSFSLNRLQYTTPQDFPGLFLPDASDVKIARISPVQAPDGSAMIDTMIQMEPYSIPVLFDPVEGGGFLGGVSGNTATPCQQKTYRFRVPLESNGQTEIQVACTAPFDIAYRLFDGAGNLVDGFVDAGFGGGTEQGQYTLFTNVDYYIQVGGYPVYQTAGNNDVLRGNFAIQIFIGRDRPVIDLGDDDGDGFANGVDPDPSDPDVRASYGDVDGDGVTVFRDALVLFRMLPGPIAYNELWDLDRNFIVDDFDAYILWQWSLGRLPVLPAD